MQTPVFTKKGAAPSGGDPGALVAALAGGGAPPGAPPMGGPVECPACQCQFDPASGEIVNAGPTDGGPMGGSMPGGDA